MSIKHRLAKLEALRKPKRTIRFTFDDNECRAIPGVVWVVFKL